jgi:ribulose-5-phosphate 4-epimerase/fuculose-1-phosphate aldolase
MANHGMIACGETIEKAFENCSKIEENGQKYLLTL